MEIVLVLGLNAIAILVVWFISRKRSETSSSEGGISQKDYSDLETKYNQSIESLEEYSKTLIRTQEQLSSREEKIVDLQSKVDSNNRAEQERQAQVLELSKSNSKLGSECASYKEKADNLQLKVDEYETTISENTALLQDKIKSNATLSEQLSAKSSRVEELQKSSNEYKSTCDIQQKQLITLGENNAVIEEQLVARNERITELEIEVTEYKATCNDQQERLQTLIKGNVTIEEQLLARNSKVEELQKSSDEYKSTCDTQRQRIQVLSETNASIEEQLLISKKRIEEYQKQTEEDKATKELLSSRLQTIGESNATIEEQLVARNERITELQKSEAEYKATCKDQQGKLQTLTKSNVTNEEQLSLSKKRIAEYRTQIDEFKSNNKELSTRLQALIKSNASQEEQLNSKNKKIAELQQSIEDLKGSEEALEKRLKTQFELISNKIIEDSRKKVSEFNAENILTLMQPFEKEIKEFKEQISTANKEQTKERTELELKIKEMVTISQGMSTEAKNLSNALRGNNKTAGNWGETILENILQNSGLTAGREGYELQEMLRDEEGNAYRNDTGRKMIPDAIVHFPDNRNVIIDSKVSISAYTDYCNAESEEDKKIHIKRHIASIKTHIDSLNVKSYESYVDGSLDFVMMFIPNDFAAMVALQEDLNLWQNAYNKKILIISPTNLITSLKIVSDLWSREKQHQNIEKILERGRFLYDKCCTFVDSFKKVGDSLQGAIKIYNNASTQLGEDSGIIRQAEMLVESGIKSKKALALRSNTTKRQAELLDVNEPNEGDNN